MGPLTPIKLLVREATPLGWPAIIYALTEDSRRGMRPLTGRGISWSEATAIEIAKVEALERYCATRSTHSSIGPSSEKLLPAERSRANSIGFAAHWNLPLARQNAFEELAEAAFNRRGFSSIAYGTEDLLNMADPKLLNRLNEKNSRIRIQAEQDGLSKLWVSRVSLDIPNIGLGTGSSARVELQPSILASTMEAYGDCFSDESTSLELDADAEAGTQEMRATSVAYSDEGNRCTRYLGLFVIRAQFCD